MIPSVSTERLSPLLETSVRSDQAETNQIEHMIISRRNVQAYTFLEEEAQFSCYEKNEDDAYVSLTALNSSKTLSQVPFESN